MARPRIPVKPISNGPPPKEIILDEVLYWIDLQATAEEIAGHFRVSTDTLDRRLKEHFGMGFAELYKRCDGTAKLSLRRYQFNQAKKNASMAIWLGKQWLSQRDEEKKDEHPNDNKLDELIKTVKQVYKENEDAADNKQSIHRDDAKHIETDGKKRVDDSGYQSES